jgi:hypothetical protein
MRACVCYGMRGLCVLRVCAACACASVALSFWWEEKGRVVTGVRACHTPRSRVLPRAACPAAAAAAARTRCCCCCRGGSGCRRRARQRSEEALFRVVPSAVGESAQRGASQRARRCQKGNTHAAAAAPASPPPQLARAAARLAACWLGAEAARKAGKANARRGSRARGSLCGLSRLRSRACCPSTRCVLRRPRRKRSRGSAGALSVRAGGARRSAQQVNSRRALCCRAALRRGGARARAACVRADAGGMVEWLVVVVREHVVVRCVPGWWMVEWWWWWWCAGVRSPLSPFCCQSALPRRFLCASPCALLCRVMPPPPGRRGRAPSARAPAAPRTRPAAWP